MKMMKKMMALALAMVMVLAMSLPVFAAKTVNVGTGTGSITLQNGTTGETYQLYKIFDATYSGTGASAAVSYTFTKTTANEAFYTALTASDSPFTLTETATTGVYSVVRKATATDDAALLTWVEAAVKDKAFLKVGDPITLAEADNQQIVWGSLAYGYYLITSTLGNKAVTIDSNIPDVNVIDKNQVPEFDKNIKEDDDLVKINEAGLKEDVDFDITVKSKNYDGEDKIFKYVIYDTMEKGWTMKAAPVVKIAGTEVSGTGTGAKYTITYKDKDGAATTDISKAEYFEITIPWTSDGTKDGTHLYKANDEINVTYTAFLDPAKKDEIKVGATPNKNEAEVKYFKGTDSPDSTTPSGSLPKKTTETYDTEINIQKTDGSAALAGAEFKLSSSDATVVTIVTGQRFVLATEGGTHWLLNDGTYTTDDPNTPGMDTTKYDSTSKKYKLESYADVIDGSVAGTEVKAFVKADGTLKFTGLGAGNYTLTETVVPAGYNKAADINFGITFNSETKKFASDNSAVSLTGEATNVFETTVVNQKGTELPSTGGIGTRIFYTIGAILVVAALALIVCKRRFAKKA